MSLVSSVLIPSVVGAVLCAWLVTAGLVHPALGVGLSTAVVLVAVFRRARGFSVVRRHLEGLAVDQPPGAPPRTVEDLPEGPGPVGKLGAAANALTGRIRQRERRRSDELARLQSVLTAMDPGLLAVDAERRLVLANDAAARLLGVEPPLREGRALSEITRLPPVIRSVEECLLTGQRVEDECGVTDGDAERLVQITAVRGATRAAGRKLCVLVLEDITELRHLEQVRRDFVANVSHELKTPLTSMQAYLETVLDDPAMPVDQRARFLGKVRRNTERITAIVADLLDLARVEASTTMRSETMELGALVEACVETCREDAVVNGVSLELRRGEGERPLRGDRQEVVAAVGNLLDNAIKYTPAGGHVVVSVGGDERESWLDVRDSGPGIAPHEHERIFERFYRVDKDRSRELGGTGLGLSIVRNVARQHGGRVAVTSRLGEGSTFRLVFPREGAAA